MKSYIFPLLLFTGFVSYSNAQTVTIGSQVWMTKNLDVSTFRNGDPIPEAKTDKKWKKLGESKQPAWCYYNNDPANGAKYGKLYNWYAVNDPRGLAPEGWHIPSDAEWTQLMDFLGGVSIAGVKIKSTSGWNDYFDKNGNGTNTSGFNGLPGGFCMENGSIWGDAGSFHWVGRYGCWWSSTETNTNDAWYRSPEYKGGNVARNHHNKQAGFSIRCIHGDQPIEDKIVEFSPPIITNAETDSIVPIDEEIKMIPPPPYEVVETYPEKAIDFIDDGLESPSTVVEEEADFPGGFREMSKFFNDNLDFPQEAIDLGIKGRVTVRFIVEETGQVSNVSVAIPLAGCKDCDRAVVNVVEKMPFWTPAKVQGKPVRQLVNLPVYIEGSDSGPGHLFIGKQVWMAENLDVSDFRNGYPILEAKSKKEWKKAGKNKQPAWCYYKNHSKNGYKYGKLYNWYAVNDPRGLAPEGYHVPTDADWSQLSDYLGEKTYRVKKMRSIFKWKINGYTESGFNGLPGGLRNYNGTFLGRGANGYWWSSTEADTDDACYRTLREIKGKVSNYNSKKRKGFSVRCIRD